MSEVADQVEPVTDDEEIRDAEGAEPPEKPFDFDTHRSTAAEEYQPLVDQYGDFARAVYSIMRTCLGNDEVKVHSVDYRAKDVESFASKASEPSPDNPNAPKYSNPLTDITDLAGIRVITYFPSTEARVEAIINAEFEVLEKTDKSALLEVEERLGYHSIHFLVRLKDNRFPLPEYARFKGLVAEIQVRTILQHAWAEIEHDIQYKAVSALPREIRRRFMTLAGVLEVADREFQAIEDQNVRLQAEARASVAAGRLEEVELTADALKSYLDLTFGPDGRMSRYSYEYAARLARRLGFENLQEVNDVVSKYNDDRVSRIIHGSRQGQVTRFEDVLLAAFGLDFVRMHPWYNPDHQHWFREWNERKLERLRARDIPVALYTFRPNQPPVPREPSETD